MQAPISAGFPAFRGRRLRSRTGIRRLVRENELSVADLVWPIFVHDKDGSETIEAMPGVRRLSLDLAVEAAAEAITLGIPAVAVFPCVADELKTQECEEAWNPNNLANRTARAIRRDVPEIEVMLDVALDPYNSDGHDGLLRDGQILNDETVDCLVKQALGHAESGATMLGPSDMMDGRIGRIRHALESKGYHDIIIISYTAKYASAFYGPFRDAVRSGMALKGDKDTYQMDFGNTDEALRMVQRDLSEGADALIVKPGMPYLDLCHRISTHFGTPTFAYQVSGEYAMIEAAAAQGWIDRDKAVLESLTAFKRAGCSGVLTYFAPLAASLLDHGPASFRVG
ncbi:MAG: porphobilinogen synthase [Rhodobacteraceae bacterium]|nr:porphobilinogen synthase [Paracoccaceae bacterium]MCY4197056.1 porphobilinogen synthase [Paracoccaceae bacterium]